MLTSLAKLGFFFYVSFSLFCLWRNGDCEANGSGSRLSRVKNPSIIHMTLCKREQMSTLKLCIFMNKLWIFYAHYESQNDCKRGEMKKFHSLWSDEMYLCQGTFYNFKRQCLSITWIAFEEESQHFLSECNEKICHSIQDESFFTAEKNVSHKF